MKTDEISQIIKEQIKNYESKITNFTRIYNFREYFESLSEQNNYLINDE